LASPMHKNSMRTFEIEGERSWGNRRPSRRIIRHGSAKQPNRSLNMKRRMTVKTNQEEEV
jgi:hypothetical protein